MAFNGSGGFTLVSGNPVVTGTTISSTWANNTLSDIATGLSTTITKDGQSVVTANIPFAGYKLTGIGAATTNGDAVRYQQVGALALTQGVAASGANSDITSLAILPGYLFGCTLSTAGSSATMSIAAGRATDSTGLQSMALTAIAKTTSAWAVGTAAGGLDTGSIANNTWYHWFVIRRPDTGVVDALCSLSPTAPTLPTNYTQFRRIGSGKTNGSAQWTKFVQDGDEFTWDVPVLDVNASNAGTSAVLPTLSVPTGIRVKALMNAQFSAQGASVGSAWYFSDPSIADTAPSQTAAPLGTFTVNTSAAVALDAMGAQAATYTNTSAQIRTRLSVSDANTITRIATTGWIDSRGRNA